MGQGVAMKTASRLPLILEDQKKRLGHHSELIVPVNTFSDSIIDSLPFLLVIYQRKMNETKN